MPSLPSALLKTCTHTDMTVTVSRLSADPWDAKDFACMSLAVVSIRDVSIKKHYLMYMGRISAMSLTKF